VTGIKEIPGTDFGRIITIPGAQVFPCHAYRLASHNPGN
jgi:hypothetical protein